MNLPATPEQARVWKESVGVLLTVGPGRGITDRRTLEGETSRQATIDAPVQTENTYRYLDIPVVATWIVDRRTGEILAKFTGLP